MEARTTPNDSDFLGAVVNFALRHPVRVLLIVMAAHVVVWTLLPLLTAGNLELDLAEDLALGKEWQLGYWKHPPLPWWLADLVYHLTGRIDSIYILAPLSVVACFAAVYLLARDIAGPAQALIATLSLVGIHYYNYSAVKFAHDQMQLPFWAFTALFFYRGLVRGRALDWLLAGVMLAGAFWSKYAAFALALSLVAFLLLDPLARRALRAPGPYLMAAAFCVAIAPNAIWLVQSDFLPFQYVTERARVAGRWYHYVTYPARWTFAQAFFIHPTLILLAVTLFPRLQQQEPLAPKAAFSRRYATLLALGPFAVVTLAAALTGRRPVTMWGYPLWSFLPLAAILWFGPVVDAIRLRIFAIGVVFLFLLGPAIYLGTYSYEQFWRSRPKATNFPGQALAETLTREWRARTGKDLHYVAGTEFAANNVAVYSPDRPHVVVHGRPQVSPWIDMDDLRKRGVIVVWEEGLPAAHVEEWRNRFQAQGEPLLLELPRQTRQPVPPVRLRYWMVPPRP
jgi:4-amino-4-deoxy-L-arabinose transferase-like glycosyltransferase